MAYEHASLNSVNSANVVVPMVLQLVPARRVVDFGCKHGEWLSVFLHHGVTSVLGMDRMDRPEHLLIEKSQFRRADLAQPIELDEPADLAVCIEVAEHLPPKAAVPLVETLTRIAPAVLFSAAVPAQGGHGHVNERPREYWKRLFAARGFVGLDCLRPRIWQDPRVAWWYRQNMFLYVSQEAVAASDALRRELERPVADDVDLLHVDIVARRSSLTFAFRQWVRSGLDKARRVGSKNREDAGARLGAYPVTSRPGSR